MMRPLDDVELGIESDVELGDVELGDVELGIESDVELVETPIQISPTGKVSEEVPGRSAFNPCSRESSIICVISLPPFNP
jgi:hypothetical protein